MSRRYREPKNLEEVGMLFAEIRELDRRATEVSALHVPVITSARRALEMVERRLQMALRPFQKKRNKLSELICQFAAKNRDYLLSLQRSKTVQVHGGGTIQFSKQGQRDHVEYDGTQEEAIARVIKAGHRDKFVREKLELSDQALKDNRELAEVLGFRFVEGEEKIIIKP